MKWEFLQVLESSSTTFIKWEVQCLEMKMRWHPSQKTTLLWDHLQLRPSNTFPPPVSCKLSGEVPLLFQGHFCSIQIWFPWWSWERGSTVMVWKLVKRLYITDAHVWPAWKAKHVPLTEWFALQATLQSWLDQIWRKWTAYLCWHTWYSTCARLIYSSVWLVSVMCNKSNV